MRRYLVVFWSAVDWEWSNLDVIAESEDQIRTMVDGMAKPEYRMRDNQDSLVIFDQGEVTMPYIIPE